ncbi:hypothetical protein CTAYLR_004064 [Chrysophaeum taylorii]|uniref:phosphoglycerate dehydrogenase n=1 Tax=Chrysophaeum taylorii TaxID=2483200 RepID=A0AAD7XQ12_9STRA|nr:hypothetical protein CTAYLR_004064 [Chrysophaeum taylorii]
MVTGENLGRFLVKTFNKISPLGLARFDPLKYQIIPADSEAAKEGIAHAILLRSHKLTESDVPIMCRAIARCGAGTNNCNVERMTELGVPVFNTPGANANAVKELVLCGLLLASRGIVEGAAHMKQLHEAGTAHERIEKDKALFGGREITGKTLGVIGLGAIGAAVTEAAIALGMRVVGYDPALSVEAALRLPGTANDFKVTTDLGEICSTADYVTLHAPYIKNVTHHLIGHAQLAAMKPDACLLNFARGELVDTDALEARYRSGASGRYVCDFALPPDLAERENVISIPHLGASTAEAEENAASMAADTVKTFLETGSIVNSVNFPTTSLSSRPDSINRICIVNENRPGMLGEIMSLFGSSQINILQQINASRGDIAYNVIDIEKPGPAADVTTFNFKSWDALQSALTAIPGVKSTRFIMGNAGAGYAIKLDEEIHGIGVRKPIRPTLAHP